MIIGVDKKSRRCYIIIDYLKIIFEISPSYKITFIMKIVSVGGSIIIPKTGFDIQFLKKFRSAILREVKKGQKFILIIGGGATCRAYQEAALKITKLTDHDLDWIGIHATRFNAQFVHYLFHVYSHPEIIVDPRKKVRTKKPILVAAGFRPGHSTDMDAVLLAKTFKATEVLNLSNVDYVYDNDPRIHPNAKRIDRISWADFCSQIIGDTWRPGKHVPFDPVASRTAEKLKLKVLFLNGTNLRTLQYALAGKPFPGTVIE